MTSKLLVKGRHLDRAAHFDPRNIESDFVVHDDGVTLRLDDNKNLDWWIEVDIPKAKLEELLKEMAAR